MIQKHGKLQESLKKSFIFFIKQDMIKLLTTFKMTKIEMLQTIRKQSLNDKIQFKIIRSIDMVK